MPFAFLFLVFQFQLFLQASATPTKEATPKVLNITTISANAQKESTLECWQLTAPFVASAAAGTSGAVFAQLGEAGAASYGLLPAQFDGGLHTAPAVQWVIPLISLSSLLVGGRGLTCVAP